MMSEYGSRKGFNYSTKLLNVSLNLKSNQIIAMTAKVKVKDRSSTKGTTCCKS